MGKTLDVLQTLAVETEKGLADNPLVVTWLTRPAERSTGTGSYQVSRLEITTAMSF